MRSQLINDEERTISNLSNSDSLIAKRNKVKRYIHSDFIQEHLDLFYAGEKEPIAFINELINQVSVMTEKQREPFAKSKFNYSLFLETILKYQSEEILFLGLRVLAILCAYSNRARNAILTVDFANLINKIYLTNNPQPCADCISIISHFIVYKYENFEFFLNNGFLDRIQQVTPTADGIYIIQEMFTHNPETQEQYFGLLNYFITTTDPEAIQQMIELLEYLYTTGATDEIKSSALNLFMENFNRLQVQDNLKVMERFWDFLMQIPLEISTVPKDYVKTILSLLEKVNTSAAEAKNIYSNFVRSGAQCIRHYHDAWCGEIDYEVCRVMKRFEDTLSFGVTMSTFNCFLYYFHFAEWYDSSIGDQIERLCENQNIAYHALPLVLQAFEETKSDEIYDLIQRLIPVAELHVSSTNEKFAKVAEEFINSTMELE